MAIWRIAVTNPKTGQIKGFMSFKRDVSASIDKILDDLEMSTPLQDLPDTPEGWIVEYEEDMVEDMVKIS